MTDAFRTSLATMRVTNCAAWHLPRGINPVKRSIGTGIKKQLLEPAEGEARALRSKAVLRNATIFLRDTRAKPIMVVEQSLLPCRTAGQVGIYSPFGLVIVKVISDPSIMRKRMVSPCRSQSHVIERHFDLFD
jgi:hypothetical protein